MIIRENGDFLHEHFCTQEFKYRDGRVLTVLNVPEYHSEDGKIYFDDDTEYMVNKYINFVRDKPFLFDENGELVIEFEGVKRILE